MLHLCCLCRGKVGNEAKLTDMGEEERELRNTMEEDLSLPIISSNDTPKIIEGLVNLSHTNMLSSLLQSTVPEESY